MKLLCLIENESLSQRVRSEADRLSWNSVMISDRKSISEAMHKHDPDLLLIDVDGIQDLEWWEEARLTPRRPVIFLNQEISEEFLSRALDLGADAFLPKSMFSSRHFEARIKSLLRRQTFGQTKRFYARLALMINNDHYSATIAGHSVELTPTEFKVLRELASEEERVVSRHEIQTRVFGQSRMSNRSLDVHVCALRKKIKARGLDVDSVRGVGYRLTPCPT